VVMIFVGDWLHEDVGKRWVATPAQGDRLILSTYNTIYSWEQIYTDNLLSIMDLLSSTHLALF